uniref:Reverse transcriptase domain-containing protein n=1 Tax=Tanacetum cinerariifolium TaxID=118510 RepID=A0A6L2ME98_TANCI|nr:reverse transcriptase domain-containing protein [Tanacetum cinerariifolium]
MEKILHERHQGVLPSNTIPNPQEDIKVVTTRSGTTLARPTVSPPPPSSSKEEEQDPKPIMDQVHISSSKSTACVPSPVVQPNPASKPNEIPERNHHQPFIPYPSRLNKSDIQIHKFLQMFKKLHFNISFAEALAHMKKYAKMLKDLLTNKDKLLEWANTTLNENFSECMALADLGASINLMPLSVWKNLMVPELAPTRMTLELTNRSIAYPAGIAEDVFVQVGKFTFPTEFVVIDYDVDPPVSLILGRPFLRTARALVDVYGEELTLRVGDEKLVLNVESTLKYPHKDESITQIDIIDITCEDHFHEVGIDPSFCTHKILMKDDFKPAVQHQRRVNPKVHKVIKAEVIKLLDAGLIYPISDSPLVSPVHVVPKKGDGFYGYFQIPIDLQDQEKTTFTCPYGTFSYCRMPFGLYNAPGTFQRHDAKRCKDTNLVLNWEKFHFMVREGIVLGHKISMNGGVWMGKKLWIFLKLATMVPPEDIMALTPPPRKFSILDSFGLLYIVMPTPWSNTMTHVNVKEKSHKGTKCLIILSRIVRSLTCGASTLWDRSRLHEGTNIYSWPSTMFLNGLKPKPYPQMTPELL